MGERVWRRLLAEQIRDVPRAPTNDSIIRMVLVMMKVANNLADLPETERQRVEDRLRKREPLTEEERTAWRVSILTYVAREHARIYETVKEQFGEEHR